MSNKCGMRIETTRVPLSYLGVDFWSLQEYPRFLVERTRLLKEEITLLEEQIEEQDRSLEEENGSDGYGHQH